VPALVLQVGLGLFVPASRLAFPLRVVTVVVALSIGLVCRCAAALFYVRLADVGDDGAASLRAKETASGQRNGRVPWHKRPWT
jgi:hypothetical protein